MYHLLNVYWIFSIQNVSPLFDFRIEHTCTSLATSSARWLKTRLPTQKNNGPLLRHLRAGGLELSILPGRPVTLRRGSDNNSNDRVDTKLSPDWKGKQSEASTLGGEISISFQYRIKPKSLIVAT
ncbi:hypothetical protein CEXT_498441 [Caerostris extrusa]|uniref:Uncharacterized protein n=1 Tax=Caerostris extrusa TaxID=172846 RepID=A0AAV4TI93_CAEEX|nr:hypothetical protein CEXT_498441 [Caerostris extrusa]